MKKRVFLLVLIATSMCVTVLSILTLLDSSRILLWALIDLCLAVIFAILFSRLFVRSLQSLDPHRPESVKTYAELTPLLRRLKTQNETIRVQKEALAHHQEDRETLRREFSANVSHELKTPLTSISGFAEVLRDTAVPPEIVHEFAADIYNEAQRMISLVEDIMHLSQLDENSTPMARQEVDLKALAERVQHRLSGAAKKADVSLRAEGERVCINGVEILLEEILYNLTDNGIKYNRPGGEVEIITGRRNGQAYFRVSDTGIGIPETHRSRVFERFYRVDKSHSKEVGGTGLGLSIVKHAVAYHNAVVSLDSTEGSGTTVTVEFPA